MKFYYIANIRLPTERAHGIQIMKMCEAFCLNGVDLTLIVPRRTNRFKDDPFIYYKLKQKFPIRRLPSLDFVVFGKIGFAVQSLSFVLMVLGHALLKKKALFFTRDELAAYCLAKIGKKVFWESHQGRDNLFTRYLIRNQRVKIITISNGLKNFYVSRGARQDKILVVPDGVDLEQFCLSITKEEARKKIGLPLERKLVLYTGHLYKWKGADLLARAASLFGEGIDVVFVGGADEDIHFFKEEYGQMPNIKILGRRPHHEIPLYLKAADVLVLPNSGKEDISRLYTSPMKLFEYMASMSPIVASRLPSICEILNDGNAVLVEPDRPEALASAVESVLGNELLVRAITKQALVDVEKYSWDRRAKMILEFII